MPVTQEKLLAEIDVAFSDVAAPSRVSHCEQCDMWVESFVNLELSDWRSIPDSVIEYEYQALNSAHSLAYPFLLPSYLSWYVRMLPCFESSGSNTTDSLIFHLSKFPLDQHIVDGQAALSKSQRRVVAECLRWVSPRLRSLGDDFLAEYAEAGLEYWSGRAV